MKILAVIPARTKSKRIPNKNLRLLNNKPLIYYAIHNARKSNYITDTVVTTDSDEIALIAEQMGVRCHRRSEELCQDSTTLDAVIFDAVNHQKEAYDYIITMQPTSPTLTLQTLDAAIEYMLAESLDTLISVINRPRLGWVIKGNKKVPTYQKRLNSQYLPPYYYETGAFLITKAECISEDGRIGEKIDIYELERDEAVNIDNFQDLALANLILQRKKIGIYVNGNNYRGLGHVYRALELADEFYSKPDIYFDLNQTNVESFGETSHCLIPVNGIDDLMEHLKLKSYDIFINDILTTSIDYMIAIKNCLPKAKIVNFEDDGEGIYKADLVFNALYSESNIPSVKAGEAYYIASKLLMLYQPIVIKETVKNVLITFGGADPQNYSDRLLKIISQPEYNNYHFYVVLGRAKANVEQLLTYDQKENITVLYDISNMPQIMSICDIAIISRGRTGYELAILGIPSIAMAQNEREVKHTFVNNEHGFVYIGLNPSDHIIKSNLDMFLNLTADERREYQRKLLDNDLRSGRQRVMNLINSL